MSTIKDVANHAKVSTSTVSRVLSGKGYANDETRKRIMQAVLELDYRPNVLAQSLKVGHSDTIAVIVPGIQNLIFPDIVRGVEDTARKAGFTVVLCNSDEDMEVEKKYIEKLRNRWIDGFIVSSMTEESEHIRQLYHEGVPVVLTGRIYDNSIDAVVIDNEQAAYDATAYLIKSGNKKIAIALGREELSIYRNRLLGYHRALSEFNIKFDETLVLHENNGTNSFYYIVKNLMAAGVLPDAIFATSDAKAIVCMRAIRDAGYGIPEDVSVMGFDNVTISAMLEPPLSTVSQPLYEMGALAARKLIAQITYKEKNGCLKPAMIDVLGTDLIIRKSTR